MDDRELTVREQKRRVLRFWEDVNYVLPATGAKDAPLEYICMNSDWTPIVLGWLGWLTSVAAWRDADSEDYEGILGILDIMSLVCPPPEGTVMDVRINGCNLEAFIDGTWVNKGNILACVQGVTDPIQSQINTNTANIATNTNNLALLQSSFDDLVNIDIPQINTTLQDHETRITANTGQSNLNYDLIQNSINPTLQDHETRITALEALGGASGGASGVYPYKVTSLQVAHSLAEGTTSSTWVDNPNTTFQYTFTYDKALILVEFAARTSLTSGLAEYRLKVGAMEGLQSNFCYGSAIQSLQVNEVFENIPTGTPLDILIQTQKVQSGATCYVNGNCNIQVFIYEWNETLVDPTVTFDAGGSPYTLGATNVGTVTAGGETGNGLISPTPLASLDEIAVKIDLRATKNIYQINFDGYTSDYTNVNVRVFIDDVETYASLPFLTQSSAWESTGIPIGGTPYNGRFIELRLQANNSVNDVRLDNIFVDTGGV